MTKQFDLSDFDFSQPYVARSYKGRDAISDMCVTVGVKGRTRKYDNNNILLTGFFKRNPDADYKSVLFGSNKFSKKANVIAAFDIKQPNTSPLEVRHSEKAQIYYLSSKGAVKKLYESFGVSIPDAPGTATRFYFNLEAIEGMPKIYEVVPVMLERVDAHGGVTRADLSGLNKEKKTRRDEEGRVMV